jgi:hypothetical protein
VRVLRLVPASCTTPAWVMQRMRFWTLEKLLTTNAVELRQQSGLNLAALVLDSVLCTAVCTPMRTRATTFSARAGRSSGSTLDA